MALNPIPTELTTGATDALLALLSLAGVRWIRRRVASPARAAAWSLVFWLLAGASALGAAAHALDLPARVRDAIWHPLFLLLGLVVAAFLVAALHDLRGEASARRWRWPLLALGGAFYAVLVARGAFIVFVMYEAVAMLLALAAYASLAARRRLPGAATIAGGIVLDLAAAAVQASTLSSSVLVPLDHNGLFHVVQGIALAALLAGIGTPPDVSPSGAS